MSGPNDTRPRLVIALTILALLAASLTAVMLDGSHHWAPLAVSPMSPLPTCPAASELVWVLEDGPAVDLAGTTPLFSSSILIACPWTPGTLTLTLRGTVADGIGTRAVLVQGANRLLDVELRDETRSFEVDVPAAGQLLLAFVNDFYEPPEDRNLWVSGLEFTPRAP